MQTLTVVNWPIADLRARSEQQRRSDEAVNKVARLIEKHGFQIPVLLSAEGEVTSGEVRVRAAEKLGLTSVPAIVAEGWTLSQFEAFERFVKRTGVWASWDLEKLREELIEARADDFDCDWVDFEDRWMAELISDFFGGNEAEGQADSKPVSAPKRKVKSVRKAVR